jgi:hypothetical protein
LDIGDADIVGANSTRAERKYIEMAALLAQ